MRCSRRFSALVIGMLLCVLHIAVVFAQEGGDDESVPAAAPSIITSFAVFGNELTKPEIILRELTVRVGDSIDVREIEYSRNRIYSLGLFNRVDITWPPLDSTIVLIEVDERWFLYPVPMAGIVERNWDNWYYGLGVKHDNFRGRNEKLFAGFVLGYNPWVSLSYVNPWILGESQMFMETSFAWSRVVNKSMRSQGEGPNFHEIHYRVYDAIGKRLDQFRSVWLTATFDYVEVTEKRTGRTLSESGIDRYLSIGIGAKHDTRNLAEYPTEGVFSFVNITKKGVGFGPVDMTTWAADARVYKNLYKGVSLATRVFAKLNSGPAVPNYQHVYFGYSERIRGHFNQEVEGENLAGGFAELRLPIVPHVYVHIPEVPIRQFATWRLGLYAAVFADAGLVWDRKQRPDWAGLSRGIGAGLHVLLPYGTVFRIDRAWNEHGAGEWIFDLGASF